MNSTDQYTIEAFINNDRMNTKPKHIISTKSIVSLDITESVLTLLPKITLVFNDKSNMIDNKPILDKDVLHIKLNISDDLPENEIISTFIISVVDILPVANNDGVKVTISGYMAGDDVFAPYKYDAILGSSHDVVKKLTNIMGLKFNSNSDSTESVYWYQHSNNYTFLHQVAKKAYIPNDAVFVYGDVTGTMNYISFKTIAALETKYTAKYNVRKMQEEFLKDDDANILYYDGYHILNTTEIYNNISNYGGVFSYYDMDTYQTRSLHASYSNTDLLNRNSRYNEEPIFNLFMGVISDKTLQDTIYRGEIQNSVGRYNLFSNSIYINIRNTSVVALFDKVDLQLQSPLDVNEIAEPYSGEYFITSISHSVVKNGNPAYAKRILLCRNGINKSLEPQVQELDGIV